MPGRSRTSLILLIAGSVVIGYPTTADAQSTPAVIHACYVPLTGTVYRIKETGLRTACSSTSHVEFSWTDGAGAVRPTGAVAGDLLQFDGAEWKPVSAQSVGGGVTGYEVATLAVNNSYMSQTSTIVSTQPTSCNEYQSCTLVTYYYSTMAPSITVPASCPSGKKVLGVASANGVGTDILPDGRVSVTTPNRWHTTPNQTRLVPAGTELTSSALPNQYPDPSTTPDTFTVKVVCASAI
jgi:hypothetical protein